jgi:hypothetical protein
MTPPIPKRSTPFDADQRPDPTPFHMKGRNDRRDPILDRGHWADAGALRSLLPRISGKIDTRDRCAALVNFLSNELYGDLSGYMRMGIVVFDFEVVDPEIVDTRCTAFEDQLRKRPWLTSQLQASLLKMI